MFNSMKKFKIRKDDIVIVTSGDNKGKLGKIKKVLRSVDRVIVEGINLLTNFNKPKSYSDSGSISLSEGSIHISNVAHVNPSTKKPVKVTYNYHYGKKVRCTKSTHIDIELDSNRIGK